MNLKLFLFSYFSKDCILKTYLKIFFKLKKFNCGDKPPPLRECLTCFTLVPALLFTKMLLMPKNQKELLPYFRTKLHYAKKKREREREQQKTPAKYRNFQNDKTVNVQ